MEKEQISGVVLAGGRGQRMGGADKGLLLFRGQVLAARAASRLALQVGEVLINANRNIDAYAALGYPVVPDLIQDFAGPLAGLQAAMYFSRRQWIATVPCDVPSFPSNLVARLAEALSDGGDLAFASIAGRLQPVFCLARVGLRGALDNYLAGGERRARTWLESQSAVEVEFDYPAAFDNFNDPQSLANAEG